MQPTSPITEHTQNFDFRKILYKILAYWYLFVISLLAAYFLSKFMEEFDVPIYSVHTTILVKNQADPSEKILNGLQIFSSPKNLQNEIATIQSYNIAYRTILSLDSFKIAYFEKDRFKDTELYKRSPFFAHWDVTYNQPIYTNIYITPLTEETFNLQFGLEDGKPITFNYDQWIDSNGFKFKILRNKDRTFDLNKKYYFHFTSIDQLANFYKSKLKIQPQYPNSSLLWAWIEGTVAQKEADYLNKLIATYIQQGLDDKNKRAIQTIQFIDEQLIGVTDSLQVAEDSLQEFKRQNDVIDIQKESQVLFNKYEQIQIEKLQMENQKRFLKFFLSEINTNPSTRIFYLPAILNIEDNGLYVLINKQDALYSEYERIRLSVKTDIPEIQLLKKQIESTTEAIKLIIARNITNLETLLEEKQKTLAEIYTQLHQLPITERQLKNISRRFQLNDNIYTYLLQRRMEAGITQASNEPDASVIDAANYTQATLVTPASSSKRSRYLIFGFVIPLIFVILKDLLNNKILDKSDIEGVTKISIIGTIGKNETNDMLPVFVDPKSPLSESFRTLRTNINYLLVERDYRVIAITSTTSGEGKTFISSNLAAILAMSGKKVVIVGLDLRKPRINRVFNISNTFGVSTYLIEQNSIEDIIFPTHVPNLFLCPPGPIPPNPAELIETHRMAELINMLKVTYDYVIIDTPPIAYVTDALLIANYCDANIFVLRQNYSNKNALQLIDELWLNKNLSQVSILLNDVVYSSQYGYKYGYGTKYAYGSRYGKGYYENRNSRFPWIDSIREKFNI